METYEKNTIFQKKQNKLNIE